MTIKKSTAPRKQDGTKLVHRSKSHVANKNFLIVGIGASAGGLEAIVDFLTNLPPDTGLHFFLFQHLDPTHESMIVDILSRKTLMPVSEIKNNTRLQSGHVYVMPSNSSLKI